MEKTTPSEAFLNLLTVLAVVILDGWIISAVATALWHPVTFWQGVGIFVVARGIFGRK